MKYDHDFWSAIDTLVLDTAGQWSAVDSAIYSRESKQLSNVGTASPQIIQTLNGI